MPKPNTIESITPLSGAYSCATDMRLNAWLAVATALWVTAKFVLRFNPDLAPVAKASLLLAPLVPGLFYVRSWCRFVAGMDEMQRRIQLQVFLLASFGTLLVSIVLNTLNASGVHVETMTMGAAFMLILGFWIIGSFFSNRRFK